MLRYDIKDVIGGALLVLLGAFVLRGAVDYGVGSPTRMGPGYFPMLLGIVSVAVGVAIAIPALRRPGELPRISWRPLLTITLGMLGFILALPRFGLLPAVAAAAAISAFGDREVTLKSLPVLVGVLCLGAWLIFSLGLGVRVPLVRGL